AGQRTGLENGMKRYLCVVLFSLISALSFGVVTPVTIDSASISYTANTITVTGQGFCADSKLPTVVFNLTQLKLVTTVCSNTSVVANLPAQAQGSYKLTVTNGSTGSSTFDVTYGAVGPQGPMGLTGATGPTGPQGSAGPQGQTGAQGPQGLPGATGATGPQGTQGPQGVAGTNGTNGAGFNFRGAFNTSNTYATNDVVTYAPANITYNVNLTFGSAGSMVGTITTDGTIGVLSAANIVSWNLTLADSPTNSTVLTPSNSAFGSGNYNTGGQPNNDFSATSTTLTMAYSNAGFWYVAGASGEFCMTDWSNCFGPVAYGSWSINGDSQWSYSGVSGTQTIGTGGTVATSATSTYVATGPIAAGGATPPASPWVLMAQAGATGTTGSAGPTGATGAQGPAGLSVQGPAGPVGPQGPAGPIGPAGTPGATGPIGLSGAAGAPGAAGPAGPEGGQGPQGPQGQAGPAGTPPGHIALLQWWSSITYSVGNTPRGIAFDGANIWVTNDTNNSVTKLLASTGAVVGTYPVGSFPVGIAFDGTNIWVANNAGNDVTELAASTGAVVGTYPVGSGPWAVAFDGTNIWVANSNNGTVTKLSPAGVTLGTYPVGNYPTGIAFDGANMWVANAGGNTVTELAGNG